MSQHLKIKIAIDGPAGAGKSTVAKQVAERMGYVYVDTGAMYRAMTLKAIRAGLSPERDEKDISALCSRTDVKLTRERNGQHVWLDGEDVTEQLRLPDVTSNVSMIARNPQVRRYMSSLQRSFAENGGIVMDGRDIGTQVLPDAELKVFLTASVDERARRRHLELQQSGYDVPLSQLRDEIATRDRMDEERDISPLVKAPDALLLDCTQLTIEQVVQQIIEWASKLIDGAMGK